MTDTPVVGKFEVREVKKLLHVGLGERKCRPGADPSTLPSMKIAPLGLAGGRSYDRTTGSSLRTPTMKESQLSFFAKKPLPRSLFQRVQTLCMPSFIDLHTHATPGHVTSFACS